jgi:tetratricopeptide (TPR) repeat protein
LALFWAALPAPLPRSSAGLLNEQCLTVPATSDAIPALERCSALYPHDVELKADLGAAYESADETARAEATYQLALAIDPAYADLRLRLGRLMLRRGATDDARRQAEAGLRVQPNRQTLRDLLDATRTVASSRRP